MTGTGTAAVPYAVSLWDELMTVLPQDGKYAVLTDDIDMRGVVISDSEVRLACNLDGQGHTIRNVYLSPDNISGTSLFVMAVAINISNIRFENWYSKDIWVFSGYSSHPAYHQMPTIDKLSFSGELVSNATFMRGEWVNYFPKIYNSDIYIEIHGNYVIPRMAGTHYFPMFTNCNIQLHGDCVSEIMCANMNESVLQGEVNITNPRTGYNALNIRTSYSNSQSLVNVDVSCDSSWDAEFIGDRLLVNTQHLSNVSATGTYISCTDTQQNDEVFLQQHSFGVGEKLTDFSWHNYLASLDRAGWWDDNAQYVYCPYSIDDDKFTITVTDLPSGRTTNTEPYLDWQYATVYFTAKPYQKYKFEFVTDLPDEVAPRYSVYSDGIGDNDHRRSGVGEDTIIESFNDTSQFSLQVGIRNQTNEPISGTYIIDRLDIYEYSSWRIINGKLQNIDVPNIKPIGAFYNCRGLVTVYIPPTVKKIGPYAFYNTQLSQVQIASDCEYYDTSFPENCTIEYY